MQNILKGWCENKGKNGDAQRCRTNKQTNKQTNNNNNNNNKQTNNNNSNNDNNDNNNNNNILCVTVIVEEVFCVSLCANAHELFSSPLAMGK